MWTECPPSADDQGGRSVEWKLSMSCSRGLLKGEAWFGAAKSKRKKFRNVDTLPYLTLQRFISITLDQAKFFAGVAFNVLLHF